MVSTHNEFLEYVLETMLHWAPVTSRKMFGGYGLYRDGLMFALVVEDELFFKTDANNVAQFERAGSRPFSYQSKTRTVRLSYWSAPAESLESPAEMRDWCQLAYAAALRANTIKPALRTRKTK
ncbi:MAG: TfoX/Sxy family protein [Gallionella sp.]